MKHQVIVLLLAFPLINTGVLSQDPADKTIMDLQTAYNGESIASAKYARYAEVAQKEGFPHIALMFDATSKAEGIHAKNHQAVALKLGSNLANPEMDSLSIGTTEENLAEGIKGETMEYEDMYPPMIKAAGSARFYDAVTSFRYAQDTEKRHRLIYEQALKALQSGNEDTLPSTWFVCPTCGNTYSPSDLPVSCELCGTLRPRFIIFK